jgi:pimeloyl-ACP methyl ester carboxylesterase
VATLAEIGPGLHQALLDPSTASLLPYLIHLAREGHFAEVAQAAPQATGGGEWLAMAQIIMCSEAWARFDPGEVQRLGHDSYLLFGSLAQAAQRQQICAALPSGVVPTDDAAPVITRLPILWLAGDGDPQDPPANLAAIPAQQPNARVVVMPAQQHTVGHSGCAPSVIASFVDAGTATGLDTACIENASVPGLTFKLP